MIPGGTREEQLLRKRQIDAERQRQAILRRIEAERQQSLAAAMARVFNAPRRKAATQ